MKALTRVLGSIDIGIGVLFLALAAISLVSIPEKYSTYASEPEDLYALVCYALVGTWVGATLLRVGWTTLRRVSIQYPASPVLYISLALVIITLVGLGLLDIIGPSDPGVYGLRYLLLAAVPVVLSGWLMTSRKGPE